MSSKLVSRPPRKKSTIIAPPQADPVVNFSIDYPREEELVLPGHYAIRVSAPRNFEIQVSINNGEWNACRVSAGSFYFDWTPKDLGEAVLRARARNGDGRWSNSGERFCRVVSSKKG